MCIDRKKEGWKIAQRISNKKGKREKERLETQDPRKDIRSRRDEKDINGPCLRFESVLLENTETNIVDDVDNGREENK